MHGTSETDAQHLPILNYRAKELTNKSNNAKFLKRNTSIDVASEFFRSSLPPIKADLAKAAENTKHFMTEISFMSDNSRNNKMSNANTNFKSSAASTFNSSSNNIPLVNGIESKALNNLITPSTTLTNGRNGNVLMNSSVNGDGFPETVDVGTTVNSRTKPSHVDANKVFGRKNGSDVNTNNTNRSLINNSDVDYPTIGKGKRSQSQQIIATPHQPCCECLGCSSGGTMGDVTTENGSKGAPICVLFAIFLLVSIVVISCVMVYLKAGRMHLFMVDIISKFTNFFKPRNERDLTACVIFPFHRHFY